ncbi:hypothetical protein [Hyphomicrobium sp. MC1]|uniref:hypothetical protein n=1 Tax=Hyphomicrobium sp. (strain MC1) TaxID=717785 RepID=UPI000213EADA|nr:hypothetical protein [Hyphomicrobium sp. MC1]CCB64081.1 protein of unknown function [Hyphomicrobium sp. MC1]
MAALLKNIAPSVPLHRVPFEILGESDSDCSLWLVGDLSGKSSCIGTSRQASVTTVSVETVDRCRNDRADGFQAPSGGCPAHQVVTVYAD